MDEEQIHLPKSNVHHTVLEPDTVYERLERASITDPEAADGDGSEEGKYFHGKVGKKSFMLSEISPPIKSVSLITVRGTVNKDPDGGSIVRTFFQFSPAMWVSMVVFYLTLAFVLFGGVYAAVQGNPKFGTVSIIAVVIFLAVAGVALLFKRTVDKFRLRLRTLLELKDLDKHSDNATQAQTSAQAS
jgi:hypothetical protein